MIVPLYLDGDRMSWLGVWYASNLNTDLRCSLPCLDDGKRDRHRPPPEVHGHDFELAGVTILGLFVIVLIGCGVVWIVDAVDARRKELED